MSHERGLPVDIDCERFVLGSLLAADSYFDEVQDVIAADDFSLEKHRRIFRRIVDLRGRGETADRVTVSSELMKFNELETCDGLSYLISLDDGLPLLPSIASYVRIIREKAILRRLIFQLQNSMNRCLLGEEGPEQIAADAIAKLGEIANSSSIAKRWTDTHEMIQADPLVFLRGHKQGCGITLPWPRLQDTLSGLLPGQMVLLMAATSRGKSSMALQIAEATALQGSRPVIWTMEMSELALGKKALTQISGIYADKRLLTAEERHLHREANQSLFENPLAFDYSSRSVQAFAATLRQIAVKARLGLAVVDHVQLVGRVTAGQNRAAEVSDHSRALKLAAMDFQIPFLVLSQVDRSSVKGEGKIGLHSSKNSGDLENDADVVLWIEAPELDRTQDTPVSLHVGKQREGPAGFSIPMIFDPRSQTFREA